MESPTEMGLKLLSGLKFTLFEPNNQRKPRRIERSPNSAIFSRFTGDKPLLQGIQGWSEIRSVSVFYGNFTLTNNTYLLPEQVGMELTHKNNKRNNRPPLVSKGFCNFHIHKRTDTHPLALFPPYFAHNLGKLLLILVLLSLPLLFPFT